MPFVYLYGGSPSAIRTINFSSINYPSHGYAVVSNALRPFFNNYYPSLLMAFVASQHCHGNIQGLTCASRV